MSAPIAERFYDDAYLARCEARVVRHEGDALVLDATVFYPIGGGQPGDTGTVVLDDGTRLAIVDTRRDRETREIVHILAPGSAPIATDARVAVELDWPRRHRHMRMHTCLHLLSAVVKAGVTGGNLSDASGRLDFDLAGLALDAAAIEGELNRLIAADHTVAMHTTSGAALAAQPELIKTMSVQPPLHLPEIRLIDIAGVDLQPCGGTHVARTGEIGAVRVAKIESKGAKNRRVVLAFAETPA